MLDLIHDPVATSFGLIAALGTIVSMSTRLAEKHGKRRRRQVYDDWKAAMQTHDGRLWMRDYIAELDNAKSKGTGA